MFSKFCFNHWRICFFVFVPAFVVVVVVGAGVGVAVVGVSDVGVDVGVCIGDSVGVVCIFQSQLSKGKIS